MPVVAAGASVVVLRAGLLGSMAGAALLLAACSHDPYVNGMIVTRAGEWRTEPHVDRVTGAPVSSAVVTTSKVSNGKIPFPPPAIMQLMCFKEHPAVVFNFAFKIGSTRNAEVAYRFDDKPGHEPRMRIVDNYKTVLIEDPNEVALFASELAASNVLYMRIHALNAARTSALSSPAVRDDKEDKED